MKDIFVQPIVGGAIWISKKAGDKYLSAALVVCSMTEKGVCVALMQIWTDEKHRRRGHAKELVETLKGFMKGQVTYIYTSWKQQSKSGRKLMLACGFKADGNTFFWKKDVIPPPQKIVEVPKPSIIIPGR